MKTARQLIESYKLLERPGSDPTYHIDRNIGRFMRRSTVPFGAMDELNEEIDEALAETSGAQYFKPPTHGSESAPFNDPAFCKKVESYYTFLTDMSMNRALKREDQLESNLRQLRTKRRELESDIDTQKSIMPKTATKQLDNILLYYDAATEVVLADRLFSDEAAELLVEQKGKNQR